MVQPGELRPGVLEVLLGGPGRGDRDVAEEEGAGEERGHHQPRCWRAPDRSRPSHNKRAAVAAHPETMWGPGPCQTPDHVFACVRCDTAMAKKRILFIDNRPEHVRQPVLRLQLAGYRVDEAPSGEAGLKALGSRRYDLLILDSELPNEDGWDVLKAVRKDPEQKHLKVVVLMAPKGETAQLVLVPVDAELRRPFTLRELIGAVERVIGQA
ncbi:MAG: response regulator [Actinobacteria bacterium]|nr:MAG: response regulator [Actinomycetota bacterium]